MLTKYLIFQESRKRDTFDNEKTIPRRKP